MRRPVVLVVVAAVAIAAVVVVRRMHRGSALTRAERVLHDNKRFVDAPSSARAFATVSQRLLRDAQSCSRRHGQNDTRCRARFSAAAYTSVTAAAVMSCTQPGVYDARRSTSRYLSAIASHDHQPKRPAPTVPGLVTC